MKTKPEIERRWLVSSIHTQKPMGSKPVRIVNGYFSNGDNEGSSRIRIYGRRESIVKAELTVKFGKGKVRGESEPRLVPKKLALDLLTYCCKYELEKDRYRFEGWEVDVIRGSLEGLIVVEREFDTEDTRIELPSWFKGFEVTDLLSNRDLAVMSSLRSKGKLGGDGGRGPNFAKKIDAVLRHLNAVQINR